MKKLILFTFTLLAVALLFLSPVTSEAVGAPDAPVVADACATCVTTAVTETERGSAFVQSPEAGPAQMVSEEVLPSLTHSTNVSMYAEVITAFHLTRHACGIGISRYDKSIEPSSGLG